jgi:hypothetical protein
MVKRESQKSTSANILGRREYSRIQDWAPGQWSLVPEKTARKRCNCSPSSAAGHVVAGEPHGRSAAPTAGQVEVLFPDPP